MSDKAQDVRERCSDFVQCTEEIEVERRKRGGGSLHFSEKLRKADRLQVMLHGGSSVNSCRQL